MIFNGKRMTAFGAFTPAGIDDGVIADDVLWSSKGIIDTLCPAIKASGRIVSCEPVAGYPLQVVARIECTQEGEGDPSPDNVRPITGSSSVVLKHCGKNLFNKDSFPLTVGRYVRSAGDLTQYSSSSNYACTEGFIPVTHLRGKTITLNHPPAEKGGSNPKMVFYTADTAGAAIAAGVTDEYTTTVPSNANFMRFSTHKDYADGTQIQIEIGSAVTEYERYNASDDILVAFGSTIYKGEFDFATGLLRVTHKVVAMGELEWRHDGANFLWFAALDGCAVSKDGAYVTDALCSVYAIDTEGDFANNTVTLEKWTDSATGKDYCDAVVADSRFSEDDTEAFCAYLNEAGAVLVYPLETPEIVQLNAQQVAALQGVNNLYSNAGTIDVAGRADLLAYINKLANTAEV